VNAIRQLRIITMLEGISLLLLLFVAMPLKYAAGIPLAVRIVGMAHGVLFLIFVFVLYRVAIEREWPWRRSLGALAAAVIPFGAFVLDRRLSRES
jgi:integral membrane protein